MKPHQSFLRLAPKSEFIRYQTATHLFFHCPGLPIHRCDVLVQKPGAHGGVSHLRCGAHLSLDRRRSSHAWAKSVGGNRNVSW